MTKNIHSISTLQAYMLLFLSTGFMNHVLIEPVLFDIAGRDAWISAMLAMLPLLTLLPFILYIVNHLDGKSLFNWLTQNIGKGATVFIYIPVISYLLVMSAITLKDTNDWLKISYLPQTPEIVSTLLIVLFCAIAALSGIRTLAILTGILLPFVIAFGYLVMIANIHYKDYSLLFPIFEHGAKPVIHGTFYAWGGLIEIILILWLKQHITTPIRFRSLFIFCILLIGLTIGPITGAIAEFGPEEAMKQRYPAFEQWRLVQIGKYIEHLDFLSLYQWMSGTLIRISLALFLVLDILNLSRKLYKVVLVLILSVGLIIFDQLPLSDTFLLMLLTKFYLPWSVIFTVIFVITISIIMYLRKGKQHG